MSLSLEQENAFLRQQLENTQHFIASVSGNSDDDNIDLLIKQNNDILELRSRISELEDRESKKLAESINDSHIMQELKKKDQEIAYLRARLSTSLEPLQKSQTMEETIRWLQEDNKLKSDQRLQFITQNIELRKENENLRLKLKDFEEFVNTLEVFNSDKLRQSEHLEAERDQLLERLEEQEQIIREQENNQVGFKTDIVKLQAELAQQAAQLHDGASAAQKQKVTIQQLEEANSMLITKQYEQQKKTAQLLEMVEKLNRRNQQLERENSSLCQQAEQQKKLISDSTNKVEQYQASIAEYNEIMLQMKQAIINMQEQNQELARNSNRILQENDCLKTSQIQQEQENKSIINELTEAIEAQTRYSEKVNFDYEQLKQHAGEISELNQQLQDQNQQLIEEKQNILDENAILRSDLISAMKQLDALQNGQCTTARKNDQLKMMVQELQHLVKDALNACQGVKDEATRRANDAK